MFSHVMVGSNDIDRSQRFYDALFGKEAFRDPRDRPQIGGEVGTHQHDRKPFENHVDPHYSRTWNSFRRGPGLK